VLTDGLAEFFLCHIYCFGYESKAKHRPFEQKNIPAFCAISIFPALRVFTLCIGMISSLNRNSKKLSDQEKKNTQPAIFSELKTNLQFKVSKFHF